MTNSGVVGLDAYDLAWLKQLPHPFDLPGFDIVLAGEMLKRRSVLTRPTGHDRGFSPFGEAGAPRAASLAASVHGGDPALPSRRFGPVAGGVGTAQCLRPRLSARRPTDRYRTKRRCARLAPDRQRARPYVGTRRLVWLAGFRLRPAGDRSGVQAATRAAAALYFGRPRSAATAGAAGGRVCRQRRGDQVRRAAGRKPLAGPGRRCLVRR